MSQGLLLGSPAQQRIPNGTTTLPLAGVQVSDGVTVANNRFSLAETGNYWVPITLALVGAGGDRSFSLALVNITTGIPVQTFNGLVATGDAGDGDYMTLYAAFNVANPAHEFEFQLTCIDTVGPNVLTLRSNGFFAMVQSYLASSVLADAIQRTSAGTNFFAAAGTSAYQIAVTADPNPRLEVFASGTMQWGSGAAVADISLSRSGANTLFLTTTANSASGQLTFREVGGAGTTTFPIAFLMHAGDVINQPWTFAVGNSANVSLGRENPVVSMGFNANVGGVIVAGQPAIGVKWEEAFESPAATFLAEYHNFYTTSAGTELRVFSFAANRATNVISASFRSDALSFNRRSDNAQVYNMNLANGVFSVVLAGSQFQKDTNAEHWLTQRNAVNSNFIGLIHANAQDIVQLQGQNGSGTQTTGNFAIGGPGETAAALWEGGTNVLTIRSGVAPGAAHSNSVMLSGNLRGGLAGRLALHVLAENGAINVIGDISNFPRGANVVAAASITPTGNTFHVTGNTNIDTVTVANINDGTIITMVFDGTPTVGDGTGNLILAGALVATANDTLTLMKDGASWIEVARSVN